MSQQQMRTEIANHCGPKVLNLEQSEIFNAKPRNYTKQKHTVPSELLNH